MKKIILAVLIAVVFIAPAFSAISVKGGLAGGAFRVSGVMDLRQLNDRMGLAGEAGYAVGQNYSILTAGLIGTMKLRGNISGIINVDYSAYSNPVNLPLLGDVLEKTGVGAGIGLKMDVRDDLYAQVGYDTRLGALAEAGFIFRK